MTNYWINKYQPLAFSRRGLAAAVESGEPPFVDGSHRREPFLSPTLATISSICRGRLFAPRLAKDDVVVYITNKAHYLNNAEASVRLTAVLRVVEVFPSHREAAEWLVANGHQVRRTAS